MNYKEETYIDLDGQELTKKIFNTSITYYFNKQNQYHRLDGPAVIWNGKEYWFKKGLLHRLDGPAEIWSDGTEEYYLEGKPVSKREVDLMWLRKQVGK